MESQEQERFYSHLAALRGVELVPSVGAWILMKVDDAEQFAARVNRQLEQAAVSVPEHVAGAVRLPVRDAKLNDIVIKAVAKVVQNGDSEEGDDEELDE